MSTVPLLLALGVAAGLALVAGAVVPARRESLAVTIARVDAITANPDQPLHRSRWWQSGLERLTATCSKSSRRWWSIPAADLMVLRQTPLAFTTRRLTAAGIGLLAATVLGAGVLPLAQLPLAGLAGAALGWLLPASIAARAAKAARVEFAAAIAVLCDLTAQERDAGRAPAQAIAEATAVADGWAATLVRARLRSAQRLGHTPADALTALSEQIQVRELADLAEIIATAAEGAAISRALRDKATALRATAIQTATATANARVEWLVWPVALLVVGMLLLVLRGVATQVLTP
ncbi:pilus assembly protein TadB [Kutzneria sp. NPDC052558]|uniref:pilus assembly protein TadB n=1 Tax=Kutzneria sp. NPDC052558 TaxID=3364121 RepID=UPI0037C6A87F